MVRLMATATSVPPQGSVCLFKLVRECVEVGLSHQQGSMECPDIRRDSHPANRLLDVLDGSVQPLLSH
jgi:hypothetical protein